MIISLLLLPHGPQEAAAQLKFAALGNWGFDSGSQQQVADTLKKIAHTEHLSFMVSPGSNFAGGVSGPQDPKWKRLFEDVYSDPSGALKMPFFTVLGAEDWSGNYTAEAIRTEVAYSPTVAENEEGLSIAGTADATSAMESQLATTYPKWTLPNWWYHYLMHFPASTGTAFINSGHKDMSVGLVFLDTWVLSSSFPFSDVRTKAWEDAERTLSLATKLLDYIIVVTDRPIFSSGSSKGDSALQYYLKPLIEKADVDLYISGYDFSQEVIVNRGITYVNCGAGSFGVGSSMVKDRGSQFYTGQAGFCLFELNAEGIVTRLVDGLSGETLFAYKQLLKRRPERKTIDAFKFVSQLPEVKYWAVPSMGKMPGRDVFVRVVGTIGLCIATFFASLSVASLVSRYTK
ncbi:LOW QUALITY PROTEIN: glideosome-associated protein 50-like [Ochotona princeps]|uniref:LOW QUALITY PROTEIN: glideosome-associated protein 50-like n=1 Tax=Ochotona princeps TaxID=9978 RepID=UPI002714D5B9|nr:LOW QUALITY PROTEIN: glideosome-associated protein 50-like [Ochotona princeps]